MKPSIRLFLAISCIAFSSAAASAGVIYSNIGTGFPGDSNGAYNAGVTFEGTSFTTTSAGTLFSLEFVVKGTTSPVTVGLYTNSGGQPGTLLESWSAVVPVGTSFPPPAATILTSVVRPSLSAATQYWLVFTQSSEDQVTWFANDEGVAGGIWGGSSITTLSQGFSDAAAPGIQLNTAPPPTIYISDSQNNRIRTVNTGSGTIATITGNGTAGYTGDGGPATSAELHTSFGDALDSAGNLYIADTLNNVVRKVSTTGTITTVAGTGAPSYSGDGGPATSAGLNSPTGVAVDSSGNLYVADQRNERIRKVTAGVITTVAGNGTVGFSGDGGLATNAQLYYPEGIAVDGSGNLYIADSDNQRIRKVNTGGTISTIAGNGNVGFNCNNGTATGLALNHPSGVAVDGSGNLYIADYGNQCVRKVAAGNIATVAGNGTASYGGDGGPATSAELNYPTGVAVDSSGDLYIADYVNSRVRMVNATGTITTVAGTGTAGFSGDGGPATSAQLYNPTGVAVTPAPSPLAGP
jgi:sugar lactone lactonase YvrE